MRLEYPKPRYHASFFLVNVSTALNELSFMFFFFYFINYTTSKFRLLARKAFVINAFRLSACKTGSLKATGLHQETKSFQL